jgi:predicted histone-like DNA-binding protein
MATKKIPFQYYLKVDKSSNPKKSGKYYAKRFKPTVLGTRGLAEHMISHGVIAERSEVEDVLNALVTCIPELLSQGMNVKLQGLGTFRATMTSRGAATKADYSVQKHVKGIHMRFIPDQTDLDNMTSKLFREQCSMICIGYEDGQTGDIRPVSAYVPQP